MSEEIEAKAAGMGWVPADQWKGDPEKWRPAQEFVDRGENLIPILKDRVSKLEADLQMTARLNQAEIEQVKKASYAQAKQEYLAKLEALELKELEAFQNGDAEAFQRVKQEKAKLPPPAVPAPVAKVDPAFVDWQSKNAWYQTDPELTEYADFIGVKMAQENPHADPATFYQKVGEKVRKARPDKFSNPRRSDPGEVEGGAPATGTKKGGKTFNDMPASAQQTFHRLAKNFERQGRKLTKEQYTATYFEQ